MNSQTAAETEELRQGISVVVSTGKKKKRFHITPRAQGLWKTCLHLQPIPATVSSGSPHPASPGSLL